MEAVMPISKETAETFMQAMEAQGVTEQDLVLILENKVFLPRAATTLKSLCEQIRSLALGIYVNPEEWPTTYTSFYLKKARELLAEMVFPVPGKREYVTRVFSALLFLQRHRPKEKLNASNAGRVLEVSRQAVSRGLEEARVSIEELRERLP